MLKHEFQGLTLDSSERLKQNKQQNMHKKSQIQIFRFTHKFVLFIEFSFKSSK